VIPRRALLRSILASAISDAAAIGLIATATWMIVRAADRPPLSALALGIAGVRAFAMIRGSFRYVERLASHDAALRALADLRVRVYAALSGRERHSGALLATAVGEVDAVTDLVVRSLIPAGSAAFVAAGTLAWIFQMSVAAGALVAAGLLVAGIVLPLFARRRNDADVQAEVAESTVDVLAGAADLAVAGASASALRTAEIAGHRLADRQRRAPAYGITALVMLCSGLAALGVLATTHSAVLTLATLAIFEICQPLPAAAQHYAQSRASLRRVAELLDRPANSTTGRTEARGVLDVRNLSVDYGDGPVLHDISLELPPGRRIALVGASGSGKSSLLAALLGLVPYSGTITIGGIPAAECDLPKCISGVIADAHVFHASIADNLRVGRPDASDAMIADALRRAALSDWISILPDGLSTVVGEDAALLSGGQRQRLLLARALLADPPILLLDEPYEGLDPATADAVMRDVLAATADRTTILVTHRPIGLESVDEVLLLDAGRVAAPVAAG
jgi:thiol reductant ABC exporter CydC subunit